MENYDDGQMANTSNVSNSDYYENVQPTNNINPQSAVKAALGNIEITQDALQEAATAMEQNEVSKDTNEKSGDGSFENR